LRPGSTRRVAEAMGFTKARTPEGRSENRSMSKIQHTTFRRLGALAVALGLLWPGSATPQAIEDSILFTSVVPPNVVLLLDNSMSMNEIVQHPAYDPTHDYAADPAGCNFWDGNLKYAFNSKSTETHCGGVKRTIWVDSNTSPQDTIWDGNYLNWYFSHYADDPIETEIAAGKDNESDCNGGQSFLAYRRARLTALQQVVLDVMCEANDGRGAKDGIRFGTAHFREPDAATSPLDANGAFLGEGIGDNTPTHANDLEAHVANFKANSNTPLAEALFQIYTYFMSRGAAGDRPKGADGLTRFPAYPYDPNGGNDPSKVFPDPMQFECQRSFVILVTDGVPTADDFDVEVTTDEAVGFDLFANLIGDYNADGETEVPGAADERSFYLDDIAKFMQENDFRPKDFADDQVIDVYTVGFKAGPVADDLLGRTAAVANGIFYDIENFSDLKKALIDAVTDIIEKTQSFTAATVPSSRTSDGGDFYTSFFLPLGDQAMWDGNLEAYHITAGGDILDKNGACALIDPTAGECNSGPFDPAAVPYWNAAEQVALPASRTLYTTVLSAGTPTRVSFDMATLDYLDLNLDVFDAPPDPAPNRTYSGLLSLVPGSTALNEEGLADELIQYLRGCTFGTGVDVPSTDVAVPAPCDPRDHRLGDIFHSGPKVVRGPSAINPEKSYQSFKSTYNTRDRVIYTGANDGFLHAFDAGTWDAVAVPPGYTEGTGDELFGFMPWHVRQSIKFQPVPVSAIEHYSVDGSPQAADIWFYPAANTTTKKDDGSEWHTVLMGGLRQGGRSYFALDATDPSNASYPKYLWEFPREDDANDENFRNTSHLPWMGQTWSEPVMTRIRVRVGSAADPTNGGKGYERWVAIFGAGYDTRSDPNHVDYDANANAGRGVFMVDVKTGKVLAAFKFDRTATDPDPLTEEALYAFTASPAVFDLDFDGYADVFYIGDLGGRMWKFAIKDLVEDRVNDGTGLVTEPGWTTKIFFEGPTFAPGGGLPDFYPSFYFRPSGALVSGKLILAFGSGQRQDLTLIGDAGKTGDDNRFYVISDLDPWETASPVYDTLIEKDLTDVTADESCVAIVSRGYFFLGVNAEKFVGRSEIFAGTVFAVSYVPDALFNPCKAGGGSSNLYAFDLRCGKGFFTDASGDPTRDLDLGVGFPTDPRISISPDGSSNRVYIEQSGAELESYEAPDTPPDFGLLYWRELP
jgi:type IV pilus assembly protein PilY1